MVTKPCPKCQQHVPVACKACPCGHVFFVARRPISVHKTGRTEDGEIKRRRTERTKRERPDYFNSLQFDNELKVKRVKNVQKTRKKTENLSVNEKEGEGSNSEGSEATNTTRTTLNAKSRKRGRPKKNFTSEKPEKDKDDDMDMFANLSKEKEQQFSIILAEINRKLLQQQFKIE